MKVLLLCSLVSLAISITPSLLAKGPSVNEAHVEDLLNLSVSQEPSTPPSQPGGRS